MKMRRDYVMIAHRGFACEQAACAEAGQPQGHAGGGFQPFPFFSRDRDGLAHSNHPFVGEVSHPTIGATGHTPKATPAGRANSFPQAEDIADLACLILAVIVWAILDIALWLSL
ncbi:hypothetical protein [Sphingobium sp. HDIP04]|uniref:hypothetical protein n=1 Tax=Sphingobium sp. HDIP04 TaxID=428994 RepID=UPI001268E0D2|nr:hypothetical protein [Sphingobium sp. HDIP04]